MFTMKVLTQAALVTRHLGNSGISSTMQHSTLLALFIASPCATLTSIIAKIPLLLHNPLFDSCLVLYKLLTHLNTALYRTVERLEAQVFRNRSVYETVLKILLCSFSYLLHCRWFGCSPWAKYCWWVGLGFIRVPCLDTNIRYFRTAGKLVEMVCLYLCREWLKSFRGAGENLQERILRILRTILYQKRYVHKD